MSKICLDTPSKFKEDLHMLNYAANMTIVVRMNVREGVSYGDALTTRNPC